MMERTGGRGVHFIQGGQNGSQAGAAFGCVFGTIRVSSWLDMRARLLLVAAALVAYGASLGSGFHFDDYAIFSGPLLTPGRAWLAPGVLTRISFWLNRSEERRVGEEGRS